MTTPAGTHPASAETITVRHARPEEYEAVGEITVRAFAAGPYGHLPRSAERDRLERDAGARARSGALLVAVTGAGEILGSSTVLRPGTAEARLARAGEAEVRLLAVDPQRQGSGAGALLVQASVAEARSWGARTLVLDTGSRNERAQQLYDLAGFTRVTDRDPEPYAVDGALPVVFVLDLAGEAS